MIGRFARTLSAWLLLWGLASGLNAQVIERSAEPTFDPFQPQVPDLAEPISRYKKGFFQRLEFSGGLLAPTTDDLEVRHLQTSLSVAVPLGSLENILVVTPNFRVDELSSSLAVDVPNHLYQTGVSFLWKKDWSDRWSTLAIGTPSLRTDFETPDDRVRLFGLVVAQYQWIPDVLEISFGGVYLDRQDLPVVLPAAGLVWTPTPDWKFDLMFPRPRIEYCINRDSCRSEDWVYLSTALGGTTWDVQRASGASDELSLKDYRLLIGWDRVIEGGGGVFVEGGYAFGRKLEYETGGETVDLSDAWVIQAGFRF